MNRFEYEPVKIKCLTPTFDGDVNTIEFKLGDFINMGRSRLIVPAGVRVSYISATIDGNEVCGGKLYLHPQNLSAFEFQNLHIFFSNIQLMQSVPVVINIIASAPIMVEAYTLRQAHVGWAEV